MLCTNRLKRVAFQPKGGFSWWKGVERCGFSICFRSIQICHLNHWLIFSLYSTSQMLWRSMTWNDPDGNKAWGTKMLPLPLHDNKKNTMASSECSDERSTYSLKHFTVRRTGRIALTLPRKHFFSASRTLRVDLH